MAFNNDDLSVMLQVEASQSMIRIVGLSATLPNFRDVGSFLRVNPSSGLFHFDASYRCARLATSNASAACVTCTSKRVVAVTVTVTHVPRSNCHPTFPSVEEWPVVTTARVEVVRVLTSCSDVKSEPLMG